MQSRTLLRVARQFGFQRSRGRRVSQRRVHRAVSLFDRVPQPPSFRNTNLPTVDEPQPIGSSSLPCPAILPRPRQLTRFPPVRHSSSPGIPTDDLQIGSQHDLPHPSEFPPHGVIERPPPCLPHAYTALQQQRCRLLPRSPLTTFTTPTTPKHIHRALSRALPSAEPTLEQLRRAYLLHCVRDLPKKRAATARSMTSTTTWTLRHD